MKIKSLVRKHLNGETAAAQDISRKTAAARKDLDLNYETAKGRGYTDDKIVSMVMQKHGVSRETAYELIASVRQQHINEQNRVYKHSSFIGSRS